MHWLKHTTKIILKVKQVPQLSCVGKTAWSRNVSLLKRAPRFGNTYTFSAVVLIAKTILVCWETSDDKYTPGESNLDS